MKKIIINIPEGMEVVTNTTDETIEITLTYSNDPLKKRYTDSALAATSATSALVASPAPAVLATFVASSAAYAIYNTLVEDKVFIENLKQKLSDTNANLTEGTFTSADPTGGTGPRDNDK